MLGLLGWMLVVGVLIHYFVYHIPRRVLTADLFVGPCGPVYKMVCLVGGETDGFGKCVSFGETGGPCNLTTQGFDNALDDLVAVGA